MNGRMWVESELGRGSLFHFTATFLRTEPPQLPGEDVRRGLEPAKRSHAEGLTASVPRAHVLLTEDNNLNQKLATKLLEKHGFKVSFAKNGREAVDAVVNANWSFDAVLMDVQMLLMDGLEATREIRRLESSLALHIPIIALTAHDSDSGRDLCLAAGMDRHLTKPIQTDVLLSTLHAFALAKAGSPVA